MVAVRTYHFFFWIFIGNKPGGVVYISYYKASVISEIPAKLPGINDLSKLKVSAPVT